MRAASALIVAVGLGVALGLLLTGIGLGCTGFNCQLGILVIIAASAYLGWLAAQLAPPPLSILVAPALAVIMITALFGVKFVRLPSAPIVGDGFDLLVPLYVVPGALGALLGHVRWLRASDATAAARSGLWVTAFAVAIGAASYALYAVMVS